MGISRLNESFRNSKQNYILAIAINKYRDNKISQLNNCCLDATRFIKTMTNNFWCFNEGRVKKIFDSCATKENILYAIREAVSNKPDMLNSNLIIYFSCHGEYRYPKGYIVPYDADSSNTRTFISYNHIISLVKDSKLHHIVIISDACYGGTIFKQLKSVLPEPNAYRYQSRWGLTSGGKEKVNDGKKKQGSPFSKALIKVLTKERSAETQSLTLREIHGELCDELQLMNENQTPETLPLEIENFDYNSGQFVFFPRQPIFIDIPLPNKPWIKNDPKPEPISPTRAIPESPQEYQKGSFLTVLLLFLIGFLLINSRHKSERNNSTTIEQGGYVPDGLFDVPPKRVTPREPQTKNIGNENKLPNSEIIIPNVQPIQTTTKFVRFDEKGNIVYVNERKLDIVKKIEATEQTDSTNVVFVGSFNVKDNAEFLISNLKSIGYKNAEIIMKENLPYAVVVSGFYANKKDAKTKVNELKKKGFDVYLAKRYWRDIYRN